MHSFIVLLSFHLFENYDNNTECSESDFQTFYSGEIYYGSTNCNISFGVDILLVKEIYRHKAISPIPGAPPHLCGLMNLRGRIVTVIDLGVCLNRPATDNIEACRLLIFKTQSEIRDYAHEDFLKDVYLGEDIVGFLINRMDDVLTVENKDILPTPPNLADVDEDLIKGVIRQGKQLVILLDLPAVLESVMSAVVESKES